MGLHRRRRHGVLLLTPAAPATPREFDEISECHLDVFRGLR